MPGMGFGFGFGFHRRASGSAAFTPADLFAASEGGAWHDPSDLSTLWKDTAGTDPVTADGDAVARIDDKSGNGNHATQATSAARPVYKTSGGLHWLQFDGVDDHLEFTNPVTGTVAHSVFCAMVPQEAVSVNLSYFELGSGAAGSLRFFTIEVALRVSGGNVVYDASLGNGVKGVISQICAADANVTDNRAWLAGTELGVSSSSAQAMDTGAGGVIGKSDGSFAFDFYGGVIVAAQKLDDREDTEAYLNEKIGL